MYGTLANILLSCYGVGMEHQSRGVVSSIYNFETGDYVGIKVDVPFPDGQIDESWLRLNLVFAGPTELKRGDSVEVTLHKVSAEVPTDVE